MQRRITDDLDALLDALPPHLSNPLRGLTDREGLLEVVMDLGRVPAARYPGREVVLSAGEITEADLEYVVARIGAFGDDNRAGIERTLHRISAIRNRKGRVVGLTCRVGRAVYGTITLIEDLVRSSRSLLLLGRPGVGKTTMLRETARVLADDLKKRVIIVDTSNEIAGDGDIPHPAIGHARRMQVATPSLQHAVMIEAVENHMPEVIVIDEIGTELEAAAARTIAERGVQLVATAHGNMLENLMLNPTLSDLIGGIQTVTLSDEEARRRHTQKSVLERKAPPTFDVIVEIQNWEQVAVHSNVAEAVDAILRAQPLPAEVRKLVEDGQIQVEQSVHVPTRKAPAAAARPEAPLRSGAALAGARPKAVYGYGVSRARLQQAIDELALPVTVARNLQQADAVMTLRNYYRKKPQQVREAESLAIPIYVLKTNTVPSIAQSLANLYDLDIAADPVTEALTETETAIGQVMASNQSIDLAPQNAYIRKLQHQMVERFNLYSSSRGKDPHRRVRISNKGNGQ